MLCEEPRERGSFGTVAKYVFENSVRAGLAAEWRNYSFLGALVRGDPDLDGRDEDFWERLSRIFGRLVDGPRDQGVER